MDIRTDKYTGKQAGRQTDKQMDRRIENQQTGRQIFLERVKKVAKLIVGSPVATWGWIPRPARCRHLDFNVEWRRELGERWTLKVQSKQCCQGKKGTDYKVHKTLHLKITNSEPSLFSHFFKHIHTFLKVLKFRFQVFIMKISLAISLSSSSFYFSLFFHLVSLVCYNFWLISFV